MTKIVKDPELKDDLHRALVLEEVLDKIQPREEVGGESRITTSRVKFLREWIKKVKEKVMRHLENPEDVA